MTSRYARLLLLAVACMATGACHAEPAAVVTPTGTTASATGLRVVAIAPMPSPRAAHSASRLADGRVLLAGGCLADGCEEDIAGDAILFDPATGTFSPVGTLVQPRVGHRAVTLADGSVLLLGGYTHEGVSDLVEHYVPATGTFEPHGRLHEARDGFSATLLGDGSILVAGGYSDGMRRLASAERYDPATGTSRPVGALSTARMSHTATLLPNGRVLFAGGSGSGRDVLASLEIFDPATDAFSPAGMLARARHKHAAIAIGERVLILGGASIPEQDGHFDDSELWGPQGTAAGPRMNEGRYKFLDAVTVLSDGRVLVAGSGTRAELLDTRQLAFRALEPAIGAKLAFASATPLADGRILVAGGYDPDIRVNDGAWIFSVPPGVATPANE